MMKNRPVSVRDLRALMSLGILVLALVSGGTGWVLLMICFPYEGQLAARIALAITVTAFGAAGGVILIGRIIRKRAGATVDPLQPSGEEPDDRKLMSRIIDSMEGGVMTISSSGTITSFNTVAQRTLGYDARGVVGLHYDSVFPNVAPNRGLREMVQSALEARQTVSSEEATVATANGHTVSLGVTISLLRDERGKARGVVLTFKNLAELKRIREQVQRTDQLASLGRLAAGMAHEIRNPLGSLSGLVELIQEDMTPDDPKRRYTQTILRTITQLNTLVENLLDFSQPAVNQLEPQDLRQMVHESMQLCAFEGRNRTLTILEDYVPGPVTVMADPETMNRALMNIVRNAFQATPEHGTVCAAVTERPAAGQEPRQAVVSITNTGSFIRPEDRTKLFTPFYTTKSDGTGLGLSIANQIVTAHRGSIDVQSDAEAGTTFSIALPLATNAVAAA